MNRLKIIVSFLAFFLGLVAGGSTVNAQEQYTNRLIKEKSPYLLQHAHNPVDWYPWGEEAFGKAKKEDKLIFLSIGYSTCHWCHVMEDESFSHPEMAAVMNKNFVCIKVDREERPDLDNFYMTAVMAMTGSGGWPLTVVLTPDLKPFYGGTYFPPDDRWGMPGLKTVLNSIAETWKTRRQEIVASSESMVAFIQQQAQAQGGQKFSLSVDTLKKANQELSRSFDALHGGFGGAPKFPNGQALSFLLRYWKRTGDAKSLEMVEKTLSAMADGGMYDHIGGGFHRYSTDAKWFVPHFEKMLYDQAILARAYLEAYQATHKEKYAQTAREIFEYVLRDMTSPLGGFYSAEDADSVINRQNLNRKKEGAFYLWDKDELVAILGRERAAIFSYYFGVEKGGNVLTDPRGEFSGKNILYVAHDMKVTANHFKKTPAVIAKNISDAKLRLFEARSQRARPHRDDKILSDWNSLMISSLSFGSRVLQELRYAQAAEKADYFILRQLSQKRGELFHRYRDVETAIPEMANDYAFLAHGLIDLYEATFKLDYLKDAGRLTDEMLKLFWDEKDNGLFFTGHDTKQLLVRQKEIYDGPISSGNSIAALDLIRLSRLLMCKDFEDKADRILDAFSAPISKNPQAYPQSLIVLDFVLGPSKEIVLTEEMNAQETTQMIEAIYRRFLPNQVVAFRLADNQEAKEVIGFIPFLENQRPLGGKTTAYVCVNHVCKIPTNKIEELESILNQ